MQLPPRPRRKLVQSLEQYAPTCAMRRSNTTAAGAAAPRNDSLGPPEYVKVAFPHSRLTLFCGVSRAPRWNRRQDSFRPPMGSTLSTMTANSIASGVIGHGGGSGNGNGNGNGNGHGGPNGMNYSPSVSRKSSSNTLGQQSVSGASIHGSSSKTLPKIPKLDFEKETLLEGSLIGPDFGSKKLSRQPTSQELQGLAISCGPVAQEDSNGDMNGPKNGSGQNSEKVCIYNRHGILTRYSLNFCQSVTNVGCAILG